MKFCFLLTLFLSITFIVVDAQKNKDETSTLSTPKHRQIGLGKENPPAGKKQPKTVPTRKPETQRNSFNNLQQQKQLQERTRQNLPKTYPANPPKTPKVRPNPRPRKRYRQHLENQFLPGRQWKRRGNFGETRQDGASQKNPQRSRWALRNRRLKNFLKRRGYGQKQRDELLKSQTVLRSRQGMHYTPLGVAAPVGPIERDRVMQKKYGKYFGEESGDAKFIPPKPLFENCFMQAMSSRSFSTSCNDDGTYSSKQCHNQRCWCSNKHGQQSKHSGGLHGDGIFRGVKALTLIC